MVAKKKPAVKNQSITKKEIKKKEIPDSFKYNNFVFKRKDLKEQTLDYIAIERKIHYDALSIDGVVELV